mmetsp:Transcript_8796/g.11197  ORF Transcript_8796/g.11197 Transcript_8796/m.11197 type:complete len:316 (-) Transcript_8796:365-1312(-)
MDLTPSQQAIVSTPGFKPLHQGLLTCVHAVAYTFFSLLEVGQSENGSSHSCAMLARRTVPMRHYLVVAATTYTSVFAANSSLSFVDYSTRLLFKCAKPLPTMLLSAAMLKKRYQLSEYGAVVLLCSSVFVLSAGGATGSGGYFHLALKGMCLLLLAVFSDSFIGTYEQKYIFLPYPEVEPAEVLMFSYGLSSLGGIVAFLLSGELEHAIRFFSSQPLMVFWMSVSEVFGYASVRQVLQLMKSFGAAETEVAKTLRKGVVYLVSYVALERKQLTRTHALGAILLVGSTVLIVHVKAAAERARHLRVEPSINAGALL